MDSTTNVQHVSCVSSKHMCLSKAVAAWAFQTKKEIGNSKQQTHYDNDPLDGLLVWNTQKKKM